MISSPQYNQIGDIPVLPPATEVVFGIGEPHIKEAQGSHLVRAARIETPRKLGKLPEVLARTDEELQEVSQLCGATVLEHGWGLYPVTRQGSLNYHQYSPKHGDRLGIPPDHILVARVPVLRGFRSLWCGGNSELTAKTDRGVAEYLHQRRSIFVPQLADMSAKQFLAPYDWHTHRAISDGRLVLADIEPLWSYRQKRYRTFLRSQAARAVAELTKPDSSQDLKAA